MIQSRRQQRKARRKQRQEEHRPEPRVIKTTGEDEVLQPDTLPQDWIGPIGQELRQLEQQLLGLFEKAA